MKPIQDIPLYNIADDKFGRENVVTLIVDSINNVVKDDHPCLVYGLYGKWGEGKTTLMNFVKSSLLRQGKDDCINIVEFNPWLVNNDEALLREFFKTIMCNPDETVRKAFKKYGSLAIFASKTIVNAYVPGLGPKIAEWIGLAKDAFVDSQDSLSELKKKASKAIKDSRRHLIVMIDDVDRLDKEELHALLRLIRQVADFDNCIYIVAMDVDMVAKSISDYHGQGTYHDGRKFLDKIVQVPIMLPQIGDADMTKLIKESLLDVLPKDDTLVIDEIEKAVHPFIRTYRELKRYCNQLSFVLPHLIDEVNLKDLCLLEAIKMVSAEVYSRIYEREQALRHIVGPASLLNEDKGHEEAEKNYQEAKVYITKETDEQTRAIVMDALDLLFENGSFDYQSDVDNKRLDTDVYFAKFFTQIVSSDLIPDRELDRFKASMLGLTIEEVAKQLDEWLTKFSASEVKRAALYVVRKSAYGDERCKAASMVTKALSINSLTKGLPPHVGIDPTNISAFVALQLIHSYMFVQDPNYGSYIVWDEDVLDDTMGWIFEKGEMNYCLNLLCSGEGYIFGHAAYSGRKVLPVLFQRFIDLGFDGQMKYSKFLLFALLNHWKRVNEDSFNEYAKDFLTNPEHDFSLILNRFIDGTDDSQDLVNFVGLFKLQVPQINERLMGESEEIRKSHAARIYATNYKPLIGL